MAKRTQNTMVSESVRALTTKEKDIHSVVENIISYYIRNYYPSRFDIIKAKNLFAWDEEMAVRNSIWDSPLSCHRHSLTDTVHDAFSKELLNQNFTPKVLPIHPKHKDKSHDSQSYYDWAYHSSKFETDVAEKVYSEAALLWDSYCFFGRRDYMWMDLPFSEHVSFFEMFVEPMATSFEESRNKVVRRIVSSYDIVNKFQNLVNFKKKDVIHKWLTLEESISKTNGNAMYKANFKKLYDIAFFWSAYKKYLDNCCNWPDWYNQRKYYEVVESWDLYENLFWISDDNTLCELIEFWERKWDKWIPTILVNGFSIYEWKEYDYCPYANIYFEENVWSAVHRGIWHKLLPKQRICDMYQFCLTNGIKMHAFPDWITDWWISDWNENAIVTLNWSWSQKVYKNWNKNIVWKQPFRPIEYLTKDVLWIIDGSLSKIVASAYEDIGINSYILWWDGRVERVSAAFKERVEQSRARLKTIKKSISDALNKSYYIWLDLLTTDFWKELIETIDNDWKVTLKDLKIKDIKWNFYVLISSEWQREDSLATAWQNVLNTLSALWEFLNSPDIEFDKKELAAAVTSWNWIEWLKFLTNEERIKKKQEDNKLMLELARMDLEMQLEIEKMKQEMMPQQVQQPQQTIQPNEQDEFIRVEEPIETSQSY